MSINDITPARSVPDDLNVVIEIAANSSSVKYELDKETGMLTVDRFMPTAMHYPCNYGFIPQTLAEDGDPVDVLVITPLPVQAGVLIRARAIGMLNMSDESGEDSKVLAVPIAKVSRHTADVNSLEDVSPVLLESIVHFFESYKALEPGKWVKVGDWVGADDAAKEINASMKRYQESTL